MMTTPLTWKNFFNLYYFKANLMELSKSDQKTVKARRVWVSLLSLGIAPFVAGLWYIGRCITHIKDPQKPTERKVRDASQHSLSGESKTTSRNKSSSIEQPSQVNVDFSGDTGNDPLDQTTEDFAIPEETEEEPIVSGQTLEEIQQRLEEDLNKAAVNKNAEFMDLRHRSIEKAVFLSRAYRLGLQQHMRLNMEVRQVAMDIDPYQAADLSSAVGEIRNTVEKEILPKAEAWISKYEKTFQPHLDGLKTAHNQFLHEERADKIIDLFLNEVLMGIPSNAASTLDEVLSEQPEATILSVDRNWQEQFLLAVELKELKRFLEEIPKPGVYQVLIGDHTLLLQFSEEEAVVVDPFLGRFGFKDQERVIDAFHSLIDWAYPKVTKVTVYQLASSEEDFVSALKVRSDFFTKLDPELGESKKPFIKDLVRYIDQHKQENQKLKMLPFRVLRGNNPLRNPQAFEAALQWMVERKLIHSYDAGEEGCANDVTIELSENSA